VKIAIIDSGIHAGHAHVGEVEGGVAITPDGESDDILDRLGHGTAVAGAIREKVPHAALYAVKVFDDRLNVNIRVILRALAWCREHRMDLVNLSLGTKNPAHREGLLAEIEDLRVVSSAGALPSDLPGVIAAAPGPDCPRDGFRYRDGVFYASPYPRPIPGVPVSRNLHGASFAIANMTGFAARIFERQPREDLLAALIAVAEKPAHLPS